MLQDQPGGEPGWWRNDVGLGPQRAARGLVRGMSITP
jgi:hypothetical protein